MSGRRKAEQDDENPEWTESDFARARPASEVLSPEVLSAFRRPRGAQVAPTKVPISIRLSREVVDHFKAAGAGWQSRIDETLKKAIAKEKR